MKAWTWIRASFEDALIAHELMVVQVRRGNLEAAEDQVGVG